MKNFINRFVVQKQVPRSRIAGIMATVALAGFFTAACETKHTITGVGTLSVISITPNPQTLAALGTQQFTAVGKDPAGAIITFTPTWSVATGGGAINSTGMFTAGGTPGTYTNTVTASSGGISATATVIVTIGPLAKIVVTPGPVSLGITAGQQFTAVGTDAAGNIVPITPVWSVAAGGGTIASAGMFTAGMSLGSFPNTVVAMSGSISGNASVTVTVGPLATIVVNPTPVTLDAGLTQMFTAVGKDVGGNTVAFTPVWSIVNAGGTINAGSGLFTAGSTVGTFANTVQATSGSINGKATVNVTSSVVTITVTPNPANVPVTATQQFTAVGRDMNGVVVAINPVWTVENGGGTINSTGLFTAGAVTGAYANTVKATSGLVSGTATVNVTSPATTLATIEVTPDPVSMNAGAQQQFIAVGKSGNGTIIPITPTWAVVNGGGTINANAGLFRASAVTTTNTYQNTIRATSGGISGTATVTVIAPPIAPGGAPPIVNLGANLSNGILAATAVTCVTGGIINADVSVSPGNTVTGFGPCVITGVKHLGDAVAAQGQIDLTTAFNTLKGLPCPPANAIVADLGGTTKTPGVYCTASGIGSTGLLVLDGLGNPNATFVFQAGSTLITAGDVQLIGGAQAKNVFWVVGSSATLGTASQWQGNILVQASVTFVTGANLTGRALARTGAVTLGTANVITLP